MFGLSIKSDVKKPDTKVGNKNVFFIIVYYCVT
jgi:hypothetical protein